MLSARSESDTHYRVSFWAVLKAPCADLSFLKAKLKFYFLKFTKKYEKLL